MAEKEVFSSEEQLQFKEVFDMASVAGGTKVHAQTPNQKVIKSHVKMFVCGVLVTLCAIFVANVMNKFYPAPKALAIILEYLGYICWSTTLGTLGWEIQTNKGDTPAEKLNKKLAYFFSIAGIFFFVLSRHLTAI